MAFLLLPNHVDASGSGLRGLGMKMYSETVCADVCRTCFIASRLSCTANTGKTSPQCYATSTAFQTSMAYCISTHCKEPSLGKIEDYWRNLLAGSTAGPLVAPNRTYGETLKSITTSPSIMVKYGKPLNETSLVDEDKYNAYMNTMLTNEADEYRHSYFA